MFDKYIDPKKIYRFSSEKNAYNIDISIDYYRDICNEWDYSPIHNREIDEDLVKYLISCANEIPKKSKLIINFYLPSNMKNIDREEKSIIGLRNHLVYSIRKIYGSRKQLIMNTIFYTISGFLLLFASFLLKTFLNHPFLQSILPEGLIIGGWVLIWEIFSIIFFKIKQLNKDIDIHKRLNASEIFYIYI